MTDSLHSNVAVVASPEQVPEAHDWDLQPVIDWLLHDGRLIADPPKLIAAGKQARAFRQEAKRFASGREKGLGSDLRRQAS